MLKKEHAQEKPGSLLSWISVSAQPQEQRRPGRAGDPAEIAGPSLEAHGHHIAIPVRATGIGISERAMRDP